MAQGLKALNRLAYLGRNTEDLKGESMKMDPEVKALWIDALRGGEYEQGMGALKNTEGRYCCLGVLTDLAVKAGVVKAWGGNDRIVYGIPLADGYWENSSLPPRVSEWAGLTGDSGFLSQEIVAECQSCGDVEPHNERHGTLIGLNDSASYTFDQIADVIEEQF